MMKAFRKSSGPHKSKNSQDELNKRLAKAATEGNADEVGALLKQGADVNAKDSEGRTALHMAVARSHAETAKALIGHGADIEARMGGMDWTPLHVAVLRGTDDVAEALLRQGADVNAKDAHGKTPLDRAQSFGRPETARKLREVISLRQARRVKALATSKRSGP